MDFACRSRLPLGAVTPTVPAHDFKAPDRRMGCLHPLEASGRPDQVLERAVIRLDDVVLIF
jgi:hypothetical protein